MVNITKATKKLRPKIQPYPGYVLCLPYIQENEVFRTGKESEGEDQKSIVLAIGDSVIDDNGSYRHSNCNEDDVIVHADSNKTFSIGHLMYRFVHFTEIHGIWDIKEGKKL